MSEAVNSQRNHTAQDISPCDIRYDESFTSQNAPPASVAKGSKFDLRRYAPGWLEKRSYKKNRLGLHPGIDAIISHWDFAGSPTAPLATWPTNFTRDISPKPLHSHNDYWRKVPLYDAIRVGAQGVEADVWLSDVEDGKAKRQDLLVGHTSKSLTRKRTLQSLYVNPLIDILEHQNPKTSTLGNQDITNSSTTTQGVYDTSPSTTLILLIDIKSDTKTTFPFVLQQLEPLRDRDWLTHYDLTARTLTTRPITVVLTGNTLFSQVLSSPQTSHNTSRHDVFFDAPLAGLSDPSDNPAIHKYKYNATNSLYASASFVKSVSKLSRLRGLDGEQSRKVDEQIRAAKMRGLMSRYWGAPEWPAGTRDGLWRTLVDKGVGILSVDHLEAAAEGKW
ncbi:MAG: hypothetical protein Q9160_004965 [Pyrenula sp. 1 TL-2023]